MSKHDDAYRRGMEAGQRLQEFREHLWQIWMNRNYSRSYGTVELGAWCSALLDAVEGGQPVHVAIGAALDAYAVARAEIREADAREQAAGEAAYAEAARRHELAIKVTCPYCGAEPGATCRTAGPTGQSHPKGIHDHRDRYRAGCGLLGSADVDAELQALTEAGDAP